MFDSLIDSHSAVSAERIQHFYRCQKQIRHCAQPGTEPFDASLTKRRLLEELGRILEVDRCFLLDLLDDTPLPVEMEYRRTDNTFSFMGLLPPWDRCPFLLKTAAREFAFTNDVPNDPALHADPELLQFFLQTGIYSGIACPVVHHNALISVLIIHCEKPREWLPEELSLVMLAADQMAILSGVLARKKAEADEHHATLALKQSQEQLQRVLKGSNDAFWEWHLPTSEIYWSDRFYDILDLPRNRPPDLEWGWQLIHPDDRDGVENAVNAYFRRETDRYELTFRMQHQAGEYRWIHARAEASWDENGRPLRLSGSYTDITDRIVAEQALQESETRFRTMADASTIMIVLSDTNGQVTYVNKTCLDFFGYGFEELASKNWEEFVHPDDREEHMARFTAGMASGENFNVEFRMRRADGEYRWLYADITPVRDALGTITGYIGSNIDITKRKQAEKALKENELRLRRVIDSDIIGFVFWEKNSGHIVDANDAFLQMVGYSREEMQAGAINWRQMTPPEYRDLDLQAFAQMDISPKGKCEPYEKQYIAKNGRRIDILLAVAYFADNRDSGVAYILDITERKSTERALAESEKRFRAMADQAPFMLAVSEKDGHLSYFNKPWIEFTGRTLEETLAFGWVNDIHPDDRKCAVDTYIDAMQVQKPFDVEYRLRRRDGEYRWVFSRVSPRFTEDGNFHGYIGTIIDIHERKLMQEAVAGSLERERLMRRVVEIINQSLILEEILSKGARTLGEFFQVDRAFILRYAPSAENLMSVKLFGNYYADTHPVPRYQLADDLPAEILNLIMRDLPVRHAMQLHRFNTPEEYAQNLADRVREFTHLTPETQQEYTARLQQVLIDQYQTHALLRVGIYYRGNPYGAIILQQCQPRHWTDDDVALLRDISTQIGIAVYQSELYQQEQRARQELEIHARKLEISNRDLEQFATIASHDLQEPLRKVHMFSQMIAQRSPTELQDYAERMQNAVGRMQDLIDDLLTLSRVNRKGRPFLPTDLNKALENVLADLEVSIRESKARIVVEPLAVIEADQQQIEQLFLNLLSNSLKYRQEGLVPDIRISGRHIQDEATQQTLYRIECVDNGIGFRNDQAERIFEPFERLHGRSQNYPGTGMGLTICRKIVERHQGTIMASSHPDQGATFTVTLPTQITTEPSLQSIT